MDSKKKIIISLSAFIVVLVATVVAVVSVLAAQNVKVTSGVNISYRAGANVMGTITATAKSENNSTYTLSGGDTGAGIFDGSETGTPTENLGSFSEIALNNSDNKYVEFTFNFTNTSTVAGYTAVLKFTNGSTGNGTVTNMKLYSKTTGSYSLIGSPNLASLGSVSVPIGGTGTFTLKVELNDLRADADFDGTFVWELTATRS